jgi:uncharacterized MAPEG superfamily protein
VAATPSSAATRSPLRTALSNVGWRRGQRGGRALESRPLIDQKGPVRSNRLSSKGGGHMGRTATALVGFAGWFALLSVLLGLYRIRFVLGGTKAANTFATDGQDLDDLGHRLTRARNNCYETLPVFAALALGASMSGRLDVTDPLAMWVLYARIAQSVTHIISTSVPAVQLRAVLFFAQMFIYLSWAIRLLG